MSNYTQPTAIAEADVDALRARVRTLEGALRQLYDAAPEVHPDPRVKWGSVCETARAALSGAQPDTAPSPTLSATTTAECSHHKRVSLSLIRQPDGSVADSWRCDSCGTTFFPCDWESRLRAQVREQDTALAEREASIVELRRALEHIHESVTYNLSHKASVDMQRMIEAALAQPVPQAALRAMLEKVVKRVTQYDRQGETNAAAIDAVLKGEA